MRRHHTPVPGGREPSPPAFRREPSAPPSLGLPRSRELSLPPRLPSTLAASDDSTPPRDGRFKELKGERTLLYKKLRELQKKIVSLFELMYNNNYYYYFNYNRRKNTRNWKDVMMEEVVAVEEPVEDVVMDGEEDEVEDVVEDEVEVVDGEYEVEEEDVVEVEVEDGENEVEDVVEVEVEDVVVVDGEEDVVEVKLEDKVEDMVVVDREEDKIT